MSDEVVDTRKSLLDFAGGLQRWLSDEQRWMHFWDDTWVPISERLDKLNQKTHFRLALTGILVKASSLGDALSREHERIVAFAEEIDKLIQTKRGEVKWPSFCPEYNEKRPLADVTPSLEQLEKKLAAFKDRLETIVKDPNIHEIDVLPRLNETDRKIAQHIIDNPGQTGQRIVFLLMEQGLEIADDRFRQIYRRKLRPWGFHNPQNGDGYLPPGKNAPHYRRLMSVLSRDKK